MSYYRDQLEKWLSFIEVNAESVLDVGGLANPVNTRVRSWYVHDFKILDNGQEEAKKPELKADFFADLNGHIDLNYDLFDVVFCLEVMEYIWNPVQALQNLSSFLKPGGTIYISFPSIYPVHNPKEKDYLRFTKASIEKLLAECEFTSWEITPRIATNGIQALNNFYVAEGMHPVREDDVIYDIGYMVKAKKQDGEEA